MAKKKFQWEAGSGQLRDQPPAPRHRTQHKRDALAVERLVAELLDLPAYERSQLPLEDDVLEGLLEIERLLAKGTVRGALRRQRLFVAGLLRPADLDALRGAMPQHGGVSPRERTLQLAEHWRRRLLKEGDEALDALLLEFPTADRQGLRQLVRNARRERDADEAGDGKPAAGKAGKAFRELFAELRGLMGV